KPHRDIPVLQTTSDPAAIEVPASIVLPAGQNSVSFDLTMIDNHKLDGTRLVRITAHVNHWSDGSATIQVLDDELTDFSLWVPARASEGNGVLTNAGTIRLAGTLETNLTF